MNKLLIRAFFPNRDSAVMACSLSDAVDTIDVLPLPERLKGQIEGMRENKSVEESQF